MAIETSEQSMLKELSLQDLANRTFICNKGQLYLTYYQVDGYFLS